jgi:hypothetical protein
MDSCQAQAKAATEGADGQTRRQKAIAMHLNCSKTCAQSCVEMCDPLVEVNRPNQQRK